MDRINCAPISDRDCKWHNADTVYQKAHFTIRQFFFSPRNK